MPKYPVGLDHPCDMCGKAVGGGLLYCPTCKVVLCFMCGLGLMQRQNSPLARAGCPKCGEYFPD